MKLVALILVTLTALAAQEEPRTKFEVRYVAADAVYISGGRGAGLAEGFRFMVKRVPPGEPELGAPVIGEVVVVSIAANSAVCEIKSKRMEFQVGDMAILDPQDAELLKMLQSSRTARKYAQVVSFTEGDPIEEELREYVPKPPLAEINRISGRIGFEYSAITDRVTHNAGSAQTGVILRADMTRIGGSYWNFTGYWRGRKNTRHPSSSPQTISDLINRTYHIGLYYNNPQSRYTMGFGRLLVPWANSLSTLDGGYLGYRLTRILTTGAFGGTTPDPTAWNYAPDRQMVGSFLNAEAGNFESVKYTGTAGLAITRRSWKAEREFAFFEQSLLLKRLLSVYHNMEADKLTQGRFDLDQGGTAVTRSFFTARLQPHRIISFDLNHNYFRTIPTFDTRLLGTGLLDRFLFQGLSGGFQLNLPKGISLMTNLGRSKRATDERPSWNQMYGLTFANFFESNVRLDLRASQFVSSFGKGQYYSGSVSREFSNRLRLEFQFGKQNFQTQFSDQNRSLYFSGNLDWFLGNHYWIGIGESIYQGSLQNYDQLFINAGYRF
ncbi:MAG: hypothetical protein ABI972_27585 [Acidobacteriota bacterium]